VTSALQRRVSLAFSLRAARDAVTFQ
jgi:hypothetical protein